MTKEDIKDWTPQMISAKIRELENEYEQLQKEKSRIVNDLSLLFIVQECNKHIKEPEHSNLYYNILTDSMELKRR